MTDPRDILAQRAAQAITPAMSRGSSSYFLLSCSACGLEKPDDEFHRDKNRVNRRGRTHRCKKCASKATATWRQQNLERSRTTVRAWRTANTDKMSEMARRYTLKMKYGITPDQYDEMVREQDGRCAVCVEICHTLVVDHDHETGVVRALLCLQCNSGIGMLGDDIDRVERALAYLKEHRGSA